MYGQNGRETFLLYENGGQLDKREEGGGLCKGG